MYLNGIDIETLNGKLLKKDIQIAEYTSEREWLKQSLLPLKLNGKWRYRKVKLEIKVTGTDRNDVLNKISIIVSKMDECDIKFKDLDLYHHLFLVSSNNEKTPVKTKYILNVEFEGYAYKDYITETANRIASKTINVAGNTDTPAIIEFTPSIDLQNIIITGLGDDPITIKNLTAGNKVIIDGEAGTVLQGGANKFTDTDMWEFPKLTPGANTITFSQVNCDINIKFKPRWI